MHLPKSFFDSRKTGELIARLNDSGRIQRTVSYLTGAVVINTLVVSVSAGYLFTYSVWVGLLYVPETGEICVNEFDWLSVDTYTWRQTIGVVPQHIAFFSGTILDNICLSDSAASVDALIHFCQQYGFATYFERFPQGYLTQLGEGGVTLSGAQRQLIALARALYNHPQLLLLDEPTAAMDPHTEQFVMSLIEHLRPQMAVLMITHKPRLATIANRLYIMANGQLNEDDSHTVLHSDSPTKGAMSL